MYYKDLKNFLKPRHLAVVGASRNVKKVGYGVLKNIIDWGFKGDIFVVNPFADSILNLDCYKSYLDLPIIPDLALIAVSAENVLEVFKDIAKKGTKNVIIFSGGFKEAGVDGVFLEKEIRKISATYGINVLGPNCLGFICMGSSLNATFGYAEKFEGNLRFVSQSGAIATSFFDYAISENLGFSDFITLGNKLGIDENDILGYWLENNKEENLYKNPLLSNYKPIGIYLESFSDGIKFIDLVEQLTQNDPVFILKPGDSDIAQKAISSHTGSIVKQNKFLTSILKEVGVIRCEGIQEFFDIAKSFAWENAPKGPNIAILTNAGGPAVSILDFFSRSNLKLASLNVNTKKVLNRIFPGRNFSNPVDILGDADSIKYLEVMDALLRQDDIDVLLVILTPQLMTEIYETADFISKYSQKYKKPIICSFMGGYRIRDAENILNLNKIPNYRFPERALNVIDKMWFWQNYVNNRENNQAFLIHQTYINHNDLNKADNLIKKYLRSSNDSKSSLNSNNNMFIDYFDADYLLNLFKIKTPTSIKISNLEEIYNSINELKEYPIVLKIVKPNLLHKTEFNAVHIVNNEYELLNALEKLRQTIKNFPKETSFVFQIQKYIKNGIELILSIKRDDDFGFILLFGAGGIFTEILDDFSFAKLPITEKSIINLLTNTKIYKLLNGYRTNKKYPIDKLINTILNINTIALRYPNILQVEINPVIITEDDVWAVDNKIILTRYI